MAEKNMQAVIKLRRDSENNFNRTNIVLQQGEVAVVATPFNGTRLKIGDGQHRFTELNYDTFGLLTRGFMNDDQTVFKYSDNATVVNPDEHILFLDQTTGFLYYWDPQLNKYVYVKQNEVPIATDEVAGIAKLYSTINGQNTDGAVTQGALYTALSKIQQASNQIEFKMDENDIEKLLTDFSALQALQILD